MTDRPPTLLVLAASTYQLDAIRTARRLGYRVITVDNVPSNPGHALADRSYNVDTTDLEGVLRTARAEQISGILAACTDVAVPTAAHVAQALGLSGLPLASAQVLTSKIQFRNFLAEQEMPSPKSLSVGPDFVPAAGLFSAQSWIMKPDRSSGCKGTFIVETEDEFRRRLPETLAFSPKRAILEEFIHGHQGTCEGVLKDGRVGLEFFLDRQTPPPPYVTTIGHYYPSTLPKQAGRRLRASIEQVFRALNVRDTVFDCDFVATSEEVFLLEVTPRLGGNSISGLVRRATGFDLMEYAVRQACRQDAALPSELPSRAAAVLLLGVWTFGKLQYNEAEAEALRRENWVESLTIDAHPGFSVQPFVNGRLRLGEAFIFGKDRLDLEHNAARLRERLDMRTT